MELRQLAYFAVLARELHFRRAAELLGTAQPTLSQQIIALENELGARLFERNKRSVRLTDAGAVFLLDVQAILERIAVASDNVRHVEAGRRGSLRIGTSGPPLNTYLPRVVRAFRERNPEITLSVRAMHSSDVLEELKQRRIQIGFGRADMIDPELISERLWEFPFHVILRLDHPEAHKRAVRLERLTGETLITYPRTLIGESYDQLISFCHTHGFIPKTVEEVSGENSVGGLVACGLGVSILPYTGPPQNADTVSKPIAGSNDWSFSIAAYWRADATSPLVAAMLGVARDVKRTGVQ